MAGTRLSATRQEQPASRDGATPVADAPAVGQPGPALGNAAVQARARVDSRREPDSPSHRARFETLADATADRVVGPLGAPRGYRVTRGGAVRSGPAGVEIPGSGGAPLPAVLRGAMERRFPADFSAVRVHTDSRAAALSRRFRARAFTVGQRVFFGAGRFDPHSQRGRWLIAHELAHTLQQTRDRGPLAARPPAIQLDEDDSLPPPEECPIACPRPESTPPGQMLQVGFTQGVSALNTMERDALHAFIGSWHAAGGEQAIRLDGYASEEGSACNNLQLSCARSLTVFRELLHPTKPDGSDADVEGIPFHFIRYYAHGETTAHGPERADNRIVTIDVEPRPQPEPSYPGRDHWLERAYAEAGISSSEWVPRRGFEANESNVRSVYAYYTSLFNRDGDLLWAGMAKLAGGTVLDGLRQTQRQIDAYEVARDNAMWGEPGERTFVSTMGLRAGYARRLQRLLLAMQKAIFEDLAWQHQAYVEQGLPALEALHDSGEDVPIEAWRDIASGEPSRVRRGNKALLRQEQGSVLPSYYQQIRDIADADLIPSMMSERARSPIPGGRSFEQVVPEGDITQFSDRWRWIERDMLPTYEGLSEERRRELVNTSLSDLARRRFP